MEACKYFTRGYCARGESCLFDHVQAETTRLPVSKGPSDEVCRYFLHGHCVYGDTCWFKHTRPDHYAENEKKEPLKSMSRHFGGAIVYFNPGMSVSNVEPLGASLGSVYIQGNEAIRLIFTVYLPIFRYVELEYSGLFDSTAALRKEDKMTWYEDFETSSDLARVHIVSKETRFVASLKRDLNRLFQGQVVVDKNSTVWDPYFARLEGLNYLKDLGENLTCIVYRDSERSQIRLFGCRSNKIKCQEQIMGKVSELKRWAAQWIAIQMKSEYKPNSRFMTIACNTSETKRPRDECPACFCTAENPFRTQCGHVYCQECLINQCKASRDGTFPILCLGKNATCCKPLTFEDFNRLLNYELLDKLLALSAAAFMRSNLATYRYCPNASCGSIYKVPAQNSTLICCDCFTSICTSCYNISHTTMTCEEYRNLSDGGYKAFQEWKETEGVKDCPKCGIAIEKIEGCNHVQCTTCKTHICYRCLESFRESDECYAHMEEEGHTDNFDEDDEYSDFGDDQDDHDETDLLQFEEAQLHPELHLVHLARNARDAPDPLDWSINLDADDIRGRDWVGELLGEDLLDF
ncbi:MAG: hypothetical protein MMC33_004974 [Icmadophila ericetorum]|nr:hypothetical protein [Icmadophila ericetorum]